MILKNICLAPTFGLVQSGSYSKEMSLYYYKSLLPDINKLRNVLVMSLVRILLEMYYVHSMT